MEVKEGNEGQERTLKPFKMKIKNKISLLSSSIWESQRISTQWARDVAQWQNHAPHV